MHSPSDVVLLLPLSVRNGVVRNALLEGPFPLTEREWSQLMTLLDVMKPGIVANPVPVAGPEYVDAPAAVDRAS